MANKSSMLAGPISELLRSLERRGVTQEDIARLTGLTRRTIQRLISGQVWIEIDTADRIACTFGRHIDELYPEQVSA